jgi:hypothetical protein
MPGMTKLAEPAQVDLDAFIEMSSQLRFLLFRLAIAELRRRSGLEEKEPLILLHLPTFDRFS